MERDELQLDKGRLRVWILEAFEGRLDDESRARLNTALLESAEARAYYFELLEINVTLRQIKHVQTFHNLDAAEPEPPAPIAAPPAAATEVVTAPVIETVPAAPTARPETAAVAAQVNRFLLAAAVVFGLLAAGMFVYLWTTHGRAAPAAVLEDESQAVWASPGGEMEPGREFEAGPVRLLEGAARLRFAGGTEVILQAPVEAVLEAEGRLLLRRGRMSVFVNGPNDDFVAQTPTANVVRYGPKAVFGVTAGAYGRTEVHVLEGRAGLRSGPDPLRYETNLLLAQGQAGFADEHGQVERIDYQAGVYLTRLPVRGPFGTPGRRVDLADLAAGGSGFGGGRADQAINPLTGYAAAIENNWEVWLAPQDPLEGHVFNPAPQLPFVDGVFAVGRSGEPLPVSSEGTALADPPASQGTYGTMILTDSSWTQKPWVLDGQPYGTDANPAILVHANAGITFDLGALRQSLGDLELREFRVLCGIPQNLGNGDENGPPQNAQLSVLIDGRVVFRQLMQHEQSRVYPVEAPLEPEDRFLTLMCTNGTDGSSVGDWGVFAEPAIEVELATN